MEFWAGVGLRAYNSEELQIDPWVLFPRRVCAGYSQFAFQKNIFIFIFLKANCSDIERSIPKNK